MWSQVGGRRCSKWAFVLWTIAAGARGETPPNAPAAAATGADEETNIAWARRLAVGLPGEPVFATDVRGRRILALTNTALWRSEDGGLSFQSLALGPEGAGLGGGPTTPFSHPVSVADGFFRTSRMGNLIRFYVDLGFDRIFLRNIAQSQLSFTPQRSLPGSTFQLHYDDPRYSQGEVFPANSPAFLNYAHAPGIYYPGFTSMDGSLDPPFATGPERFVLQVPLLQASTPIARCREGERVQVVSDRIQPEKVFVVIPGKVLRSVDGGQSFVPVYQSVRGDGCPQLVLTDDDVLVIDEETLFVERGGGFRPVAMTLPIVWLIDDPHEPFRWIAGGRRGAMETRDRGRSWHPVSSIGADVRDVLSVEHDLLDPRRVLFATGGGLFLTPNTGLNVAQVGGPGLRGRRVHRVVVDPRWPTRLLVATDDGVHQSEDRGATFQRVLSRDDVRDVAVTDTHAVLVATGSGLWQVTTDAAPVRRVDVERFRRDLATEVSLSMLLDAAIGRYAPPRPNRGRLAQGLPQVHVAAGVFGAQNRATIEAIFLLETAAGRINSDRLAGALAGQSGAAFRAQGSLFNPYLFANARWDLPTLFGPPVELQQTRAQRIRTQTITTTVRSLYEARLALLREVSLRPPAEPVARAHLRMQLDELTAQLEGVTGLALSSGVAGLAESAEVL